MKNTLLTLLLVLFSLSTAASAEPIEMAKDLAQDASDSRTNNKPIVFFVTAHHCPYCEKLRQEYFKFSPGDERFILRELELDDHHPVIGFDGKKMNHRKIADRYNITLTPTVTFVGPDGEQLTDAIVGVLTMDFYNYYFEKALGKSISRLKEETKGIVLN